MWSSLSEPAAAKSNAKPTLNQAFGLLKSHASKVAKFTLQWQELEDHFHQIDSLIESRLRQLQANANTHQENQTLFASNEETDGKSNNNPTAKETPNSASGLTGIPVKDGKSLILYVKKHRSEHDKLRGGIYNALKGLENPGRLVLESLRAFRSANSDEGGMGMKFSVFRRCCVILLEEFIKVGAIVGPQEREEAMKIALKWKEIMRNDTGSWGILGFLMILVAFDLMRNFDVDEIFELFYDIVKRREAPELFRALGFADKAPDLIQQLISQNKRLVAINYIYAFELVDKFPPVPLLKAHARNAKEATEVLLKKENNSLKDQQMAISSERVALKAIQRIVFTRKLGPHYSGVDLNIRMQRLKTKGRDLHSVAKFSDTQHRAQQKGRNKQTGPAQEAQLTTQQIHKYPQTNGSQPITLTVPSENPCYQPSGSMFADQGVRNLMPSAGIDSQRATCNGFAGESSAIPMVQSFPHQPAGLMANQGGLELTSHFGYNRIASSTHFTPHASSPVGYSNSLGTASSNSQMNLIGTLAGLIDSTSESTSAAAQYSLSAGQYEGSNIATSSNGQLERTKGYNTSRYNHDILVMPWYYHRPVSRSSARISPSPSTNVHAPYHHSGTGTISGYDRPMSYEGRHGALPMRPPFTYHF